jgi:hypothetical protein
MVPLHEKGAVAGSASAGVDTGAAAGLVADSGLSAGLCCPLWQAVSTTPTAITNIVFANCSILYVIFNFNFVDFCHDSAKQASLMALAAPKVQFSIFNSQFPQ